MKKTSKFLSIVIAVVIVFTAIPMTASAGGGGVELDIVNTVYIGNSPAVVSFTPTESGSYVVISDNGGDENIDPNIIIYDADDNEIAKMDDYRDLLNFRCVFDAEAGKTYYLKFDTYSGENVEYKYVVQKYVDISHQPTESEPYIELGWNVAATYQWYSVTCEYGEVTDEYAQGRYADEVGPATYDEATGWTSAAYDDYEANYFQIDLFAGQEIHLISDADVETLGIWSYDGNRKDFNDVPADETVSFTADKDNTYYVYVEGNVNAHIRAYTDLYTYTAIYGANDSEYDAERNGLYCCIVSLEEGKNILSDIFTVSDKAEKVGLNEINKAYVSSQAAIATFTPTESGDYVVLSDNGGDWDIDPYVYVYDSDHNSIAEDDDYLGTYNFYCVFEAVAGETYYIELDAYDSDIEYDYVVRKHYEITHQPTAEEPYVEYNWDMDAEYDWQSATPEYIEITDEYAQGRYAGDTGPATYDIETGWSGAAYDEMETNYFQVYLKAGQKIELVSDADLDILGIWSYDGNEKDFENVSANESVFFTAEADDVYMLYSVGNINAHVRAYTKNYLYFSIDGATGSEFEATENGVYGCTVTLENGVILTSDVFEVTDIIEECDCNCHAGGIKAFFFKLINFFAKLFNPDKRICECGLPH